MNALPSPKPSWLNRAALTVTSVLAVAAGFVLASAIFAVLLVAGLAAGGWLWWRLRQLTRQAQKAAPEIIDGEYTVEPNGEYTVEPMRPLLEDRRDPCPPPRQKTPRRRSR
jgi:uncharacterized protein HemX